MLHGVLYEGFVYSSDLRLRSVDENGANGSHCFLHLHVNAFRRRFAATDLQGPGKIGFAEVKKEKAQFSFPTVDRLVVCESLRRGRDRVFSSVGPHGVLTQSSRSATNLPSS